MNAAIAFQNSLAQTPTTPAHRTVIASIPSWIARRPELSEGHKRLFGLVEFLARQKGAAWAGQDYLAEHLGVCTRTVKRYLAKLREFGLVEVTRRGHTRTNLVSPVPSHEWMTAQDTVSFQPTLPLSPPLSLQEGTNCPPNRELRKTCSGDKKVSLFDGTDGTPFHDEKARIVWEIAGATWELEARGLGGGIRNLDRWFRAMYARPVELLRQDLANHRARLARFQPKPEPAPIHVPELSDAEIAAFAEFQAANGGP